MGGIVPGGFSLTKHNVYENGLVLSPRALYRGGEPVRETWSLIFDNVRFGEILFPDMQTICAGLTLGERLLSETRRPLRLRRGPGRDRPTSATPPPSAWPRRWRRSPTASGRARTPPTATASTTTRSTASTSRSPSAAAAPRSTSAGTSRQARTCINATALDAKTTVGVAFKYLFDPRTPFSSGAWRNIDIVLPEGTVVSALPPDGAVFLYYEQSQVMIGALLRALAQAVGAAAIAGDRGTTDIHNASGVHPNGTPWVSAAQLGGELGPFGATEHGDARHVDALLPGQRHRGRGRGDRVRRAGRAAARGARPGHRRPGLQSRRARGPARLAVARGGQPQPHVAALQATGRVRGQRRGRRAQRRRVDLAAGR